MKICFVCNEYPPARHGGIGNMTRTLARALVNAGHAVRVIGISDPDDPAPEFESDGGVPVWRLRAKAARFTWVEARYRLFQVVKQWAENGLIDLVEVPDFSGMAAAWPALPVPVVARMHGSSSYFSVEMGARPRRMMKLLEGLSLRRVTHHSSCSLYTANRTRELFRMGHAPIDVLHNPVDVPAIGQPGRRAQGRVFYSGTLTPKKGIVSLIEAWPAVVRECPHATLHIFGKDGRAPDRGSMQAYLEQMLPAALRASVEFNGHVTPERLRDELRFATVAVFPSYSEAFALAPMEAMAAGCPTIYSTRSSGPELIEHGKSGLLIDPDKPADIAAAVVSVLTSGTLAAWLSAGGRDRIEQCFSITQALKENLAFYERCIASFQNGARSNGRSQTPVPESQNDRTLVL